MKKIVFCGLGAVGSNMLLQLALARQDDSFIGIDFDVVDERNQFTQIYFSDLRKMPKTKAARSVLLRYLKKVNYTEINKKISSKSEIASMNPDVVVDGFDNKASRSLTIGSCENVLHVGFSPQKTAEIIWDDAYTAPEDIDGEIDICLLTAAGPFIRFVTSVATMSVIAFLETGVKQNMVITAGNTIRKI
jgi:hypothetical protein